MTKKVVCPGILKTKVRNVQSIFRRSVCLSILQHISLLSLENEGSRKLRLPGLSLLDVTIHLTLHKETINVQAKYPGKFEFNHKKKKKPNKQSIALTSSLKDRKGLKLRFSHNSFSLIYQFDITFCSSCVN